MSSVETAHTVLDIAGDSVSAPIGVPVMTEIRLTNLTGRVHRYSIEIVGPAASWITASETSLTANDRGGQAAATLTFVAPVDGSAPAGNIPFGVVAVADDGHAVCEEGAVEVAAAPGIAVLPIRNAVNGRWRASLPYEVSNTGNDEARVTLVGHSPAGEVDCRFEPEQITLAPQERLTVHLKGKLRRPRIRGSKVPHPVEASTYGASFGSVAPEPGSAPAPDDRHHSMAPPATINQVPILSNLVIALVVIAFGLIALYLLWPRADSEPETGAPAPVGAISVDLETSESVTVSWAQSSGALEYLVEIDGRQQQVAADRAVLQATVEGLTPESTYELVVLPVGVDGDRGTRQELTVETRAVSLLSAPVRLQVTPASGPANSTFAVSWELAEGTDPATATRFELFIDNQLFGGPIQEATVVPISGEGLEGEHQVQVRVAPEGLAPSPLSAPVTLTITAPTGPPTPPQFVALVDFVPALGADASVAERIEQLEGDISGLTLIALEPEGNGVYKDRESGGRFTFATANLGLGTIIVAPGFDALERAQEFCASPQYLLVREEACAATAIYAVSE